MRLKYLVLITWIQLDKEFFRVLSRHQIRKQRPRRKRGFLLPALASRTCARMDRPWTARRGFPVRVANPVCLHAAARSHACVSPHFAPAGAAIRGGDFAMGPASAKVAVTVYNPSRHVPNDVCRAAGFALFPPWFSRRCWRTGAARSLAAGLGTGPIQRGPTRLDRGPHRQDDGRGEGRPAHPAGNRPVR